MKNLFNQLAMESHLKIIEELENELAKTSEVSENLSEQMEYAIGHCKVALDEMREIVIKEGFPDKKSEIRFFKEIKPRVYSKLLYYQAVFDLESTRQKVDKKNLRKYFQQELKTILKYIKKNQVRVQYYRCGYTHMDEQYFTRNNENIPLELRDHSSLVNEDFFTCRDHTFSMIMANEMLSDYIRKEIEKLENPGLEHVIGSKRIHQWGGKKIDLAEMVYGLYYAKLVDAGKISIRELADLIGGFFGIELGKDIYRLHTEIQQRKIDRTKFLDFLRSVLQQRLDDDDE